MTDLEKEELFADFMVRMSTMDKEDKRLAVSKNNSGMKKVTAYYQENFGARWSVARNRPHDSVLWMYGEDPDGRLYFKADGFYQSYCALRKAIPQIVGVKRHLEQTWDDLPNKIPVNYVLDPEKDQEDAEKIGKMLIDTMVAYLKGDRE